MPDAMELMTAGAGLGKDRLTLPGIALRGEHRAIRVDHFLPVGIDRAGEEPGGTLTNRGGPMLQQALPPRGIDFKRQDLSLLHRAERGFQPFLAAATHIKDLRPQRRTISLPTAE